MHHDDTSRWSCLHLFNIPLWFTIRWTNPPMTELLRKVIIYQNRGNTLCHKLYFWYFTHIREFSGPSPSAIYEKKTKIIACDVTVGTMEIK